MAFRLNTTVFNKLRNRLFNAGHTRSTATNLLHSLLIDVGHDVDRLAAGLELWQISDRETARLDAAALVGGDA